MVDKNNVRDKVDRRRFKRKKKKSAKNKKLSPSRQRQLLQEARQDRAAAKKAVELRERKQKSLLAKQRKATRDKHRVETIHILYDVYKEGSAAVHLMRHWRINPDDLGWPEVWR